MSDCDKCGEHCLDCKCDFENIPSFPRNIDLSKPTLFNITCLDECIFCALNYKEGEYINIISCNLKICNEHEKILLKKTIMASMLLDDRLDI